MFAALALYFGRRRTEIFEINVYVIAFLVCTSVMLMYRWHTPAHPTDSEADPSALGLQCKLI